MRIIVWACAFAVVGCGDAPQQGVVEERVVADGVIADDALDEDVPADIDDPNDDLITEADLVGDVPLDDEGALEADDEPLEDDDGPLAEPEPVEELDAPNEGALVVAPHRAGADGGGDVRVNRLRVLHWNIAGGKENNCATGRIRRAVMRYVRDANGPVDFVSLNEVCPAQFQVIREALRRHWSKDDNAHFAAFVASGDSRVGNAIFSRRDFRKVTRDELGSDQYGKRYLLCGRHVDRRVRVCSAHLSPADAKARVQLGRVRERIERWWRERRDTVILAGDLNIHPDDPALNAVYAPGASTANNPNNHGNYRELDDDDPAHCRGYGEGSNPGNGGPCNQGGKIDFIFARANRIVNGNYGADSLDIPQDCTGACSDHRAIRGSVKLRYRID